MVNQLISDGARFLMLFSLIPCGGLCKNLKRIYGVLANFFHVYIQVDLYTSREARVRLTIQARFSWNFLGL